MLDTGADVTIVSTVVWPEEGPVGAPATAVAGVGGHSHDEPIPCVNNFSRRASL